MTWLHLRGHRTVAQSNCFTAICDNFSLTFVAKSTGLVMAQKRVRGRKATVLATHMSATLALLVMACAQIVTIAN